MATVSFIPESHQSISAMKAVIEYCLQQKKVADADSGRRLVSGVNCNGGHAGGRLGAAPQRGVGRTVVESRLGKENHTARHQNH